MTAAEASSPRLRLALALDRAELSLEEMARACVEAAQAQGARGMGMPGAWTSVMLATFIAGSDPAENHPAFWTWIERVATARRARRELLDQATRMDCAELELHGIYGLDAFVPTHVWRDRDDDPGATGLVVVDPALGVGYGPLEWARAHDGEMRVRLRVTDDGATYLLSSHELDVELIALEPVEVRQAVARLAGFGAKPA